MILEDNKKNPLQLTVIEAKTGWFGVNLAEIWAYRELFWILAMREIQLRYRQTILGVTWVVLQPLMTTAIFTIVFGRLINVPSENTMYELFAFAGLMPWNLFSQSLQRAGISLTRDVRLISRVFFPRIIIPISNSASTLVDFLVSFVMMLIMMWFYKVPISGNIIFLPLIILVNLILAVGVGLWFASLNVYYRDFTYALPFVIQIWMYASPLAYSSSIIPDKWAWVYSLNPVVGVIDGFRWSLFGTIDFPMNSLIYSIGIGLAIFLGGMVVFRRLERNFADVI